LLNVGCDLHLVAEEVGGAFGLNHASVFEKVRGFRRDEVKDVAADAVEGAGAETAVEVEEAQETFGVATAKWDSDDAAELVGDNALSRDRLAVAADVADDVLLAGVCGVAQDGVGDFGVVDERKAFVVEAGFEAEVGWVIAQKDEATLGAGEAESVLDHGAEDIVEDASIVEALRGLEEERELFELRAYGFAGDAIQQEAS
jgi:hypothetical protein